MFTPQWLASTTVLGSHMAQKVQYLSDRVYGIPANRVFFSTFFLKKAHMTHLWLHGLTAFFFQQAREDGKEISKKSWELLEVWTLNLGCGKRKGPKSDQRKKPRRQDVGISKVARCRRWSVGCLSFTFCSRTFQLFTAEAMIYVWISVKYVPLCFMATDWLLYE